MKRAPKTITGLVTGICLVLGLLLTSSIIVAYPGVAVSIEAPTQVSEDVNDLIVKVNVGSDNNTVTDLDVAQFDITYDKAVLHVTSVAGGEIGGKAVQLGTWGYIPAGTEDTGRIRVICNQPMPTPENTDPWPDGYGYLVELHFDVVGNAGSSTNISFPEAGIVVLGDKNANPIPVDELVNSGTVYVAGSATLEGHVTFIGRGSNNTKWAESFNVTLFEAGNLSNVLWTGNATTNNIGVFNITGLAPGTYDIGIKNATCVSELESGVLTAGNTTVVDFGTAREGDANNDDYVDGSDFGLLSDAWLSYPGCPKGNWDATVDFSRDNYIDGSDFGPLSDDWLNRGDCYGWPGNWT